jgi:hypothetical protein
MDKNQDGLISPEEFMEVLAPHALARSLARVSDWPALARVLGRIVGRGK